MLQILYFDPPNWLCREIFKRESRKYRNINVKLRNKLLGLLMLVAAGHGAALTLGRVRGAAVVGQPLDVSIQIQLNADESAGALCLDADVFHADSRQDPGRVRISVDPAAQGQLVNARVTSSAYIDEPMVTVYVRAGCSQKSARRYVMLADFPSEPAAPAIAQSLPLVTPGLTVPPVVATEAPGNVKQPAASGAAAAGIANSMPPAVATKPADATPRPGAASAVKPAPRVVAAAKPKIAKPTKPVPIKEVPVPKVAKSPAAVAAPAASIAPPVAAPVQAAASSETGQSRLKLDPLVMLTERVASLETSTSAPVVDLAKESLRMQTLENSVKALVEVATKNEANLQDMRLRLQKAETGNVPVQWLYGLVALVLACLAAMAYLWSKLKGLTANPGARNDWWSGAAPVAPVPVVGPATPNKGQAEAASLVPETPPPTVALQGAGVESQYSSLTGLDDDPASELDVSLVEMTESNFDRLMRSGKSHSAARRGPLPVAPAVIPSTTKMQPLSARPVNSEQLFDVRQQADFFVSLGQTDQAVQILEKQINDHGETSPLIYLDLLQIFHSLNLKTDFRQFREDFNLLFNGRVSEFSSFKDEGRSLEEYPHVLAHITALWGTRKALMVIEASIFRDSLDDRSAPFDLAAFRDLLLLHAIAQSFTVRDEVTSDLAPLRANMAPSSKGARLTAASGGISGSAALAAAPLSVPGGLSEVDIPLSTGGALLPVPGLPSVTAVLNAPTSMAEISTDMDLNLDLDLDLDIDLSAMVPPAVTAKTGDVEISEFSKLLRAQAPSKANPAAQVPPSPAMPPSVPASRGADQNDLLDFDLPSISGKLNIVKPKR